MRLSIITVNKNNANGLERTIQSVIAQIFKDFEYIIIDGASTDGSEDVIKKYEDKIDYWVSEPDKGIYNAMNKGIRVAKGEYLLFLNSGDHLVNDTVLEEVFKLEFDEDIVYGNILVNGQWEKKYPQNITLKYFHKDTLPHPASLIKKNTFDISGYYSENYLIASDFELFVKSIICKNLSYKYINIDVSVFYTNGVSNNIQKAKEEKELILKTLFPRIYSDYKYFIEIERKYNLLMSSRLINLVLRFLRSKYYLIIKKWINH